MGLLAAQPLFVLPAALPQGHILRAAPAGLLCEGTLLGGAVPPSEHVPAFGSSLGLAAALMTDAGLGLALGASAAAPDATVHGWPGAAEPLLESSGSSPVTTYSLDEAALALCYLP